MLKCNSSIQKKHAVPCLLNFFKIIFAQQKKTKKTKIKFTECTMKHIKIITTTIAEMQS